MKTVIFKPVIFKFAISCHSRYVGGHNTICFQGLVWNHSRYHESVDYLLGPVLFTPAHFCQLLFMFSDDDNDDGGGPGGGMLPANPRVEAEVDGVDDGFQGLGNDDAE